MRFLIAGFGSIGRRHFQNLRSLGEEDFVFLRSGKSTLEDDDLAAYPIVHDIDAALDLKPDAVILSNPSALHLDIAIPAAKAGASLLIEKPISHNLERVDELRDALAAGGGRALVGFQFRFHPTLHKAQALLSSGELGRPLWAHAHWGEYLPDWHPWEDYRQGYAARADLGGGVTLTLSHPYDYLRWLLGEAQAVQGWTQNTGTLDIKVEEIAEATLAFSSGAFASVHLNYLQRPPAHWLEILCERGHMKWDASDGILHLYDAEKDDWSQEAPPPDFERNDLFLAESSQFLRILRGEAQPMCTLDDGIRALEIALAVKESSASGQRISI